MNLKERRRAREAAKSSNAQMIFNILRGEDSPRDAAATIAAVHAALIWEVEHEDEAKAAKMAQEMVDGILILWRANKAAVAQQTGETVQ